MSLHSPHSGIIFDDENSPSESENLASTSLSAYDCDSEGEEGGYDVDSEDSESGMGETCGPGLANLKFQLDAARAGEHRDVNPMDSS